MSQDDSTTDKAIEATGNITSSLIDAAAAIIVAVYSNLWAWTRALVVLYIKYAIAVTRGFIDVSFNFLRGFFRGLSD